MVWFADFSGKHRAGGAAAEFGLALLSQPQMPGIRGLADVMLRSVDIEKDLAIWCGILGAEISDWAGDAAYLRFDDAHHRIVLFPARRTRHSLGRVRGRGRQFADAQLLRPAGPAGRSCAWAGTPSDLRAAVPDVRRAHRRSISASWRKARRQRRNGAGRGSFPPAPRDFAVGEANARSASSTKLRRSEWQTETIRHGRS